MYRFIFTIRILIGLFIKISLTITIIYAILPVIITPPMIIKTFSSLFTSEPVLVKQCWVSYDNISKNFFRAVIAAEDGQFMSHNGIDWRALNNAIRYNKIHKGKKKRGASTITMQTAKNTFLYLGRDYFRKALEIYFTYLIEPLWGKKRILEVYANVIEFGKDIYGVQLASKRYFNKDANQLTIREASLLAAVLRNPNIWNPTRPTKYILKRTAFIQDRMGGIRLPKNY